ncbi:MAG: hypothetical protein K5773_08235 [Pseudobutyrivibrio sp.]|nr:hypothetical protein [Pseudobutyrivibrio sp.]
MQSFVNKLIDKKLYWILLAIFYAMIFIPYIYSVFYSMPANDDFAWALEWWTGNRAVESIYRVGWNYMNFYGQSGFFAILVQVLFNPLYWFDNQGNSFGICMVIVFALVTVGTIIAIRRLIADLSKIESKPVIDVATFLVTALLFTSYYYFDVYNWWSGTPGYSLMLMMMLFTLDYIVRYMDNPKKSTYIWMIVLGIIVCSGMMFCVTVGLFYVVYVFWVKRKENISAIKRIVPIALFVISGLVTVIAPGNHQRMANGGLEDVSMRASLIVTTVRVFLRTRATIISKPALDIALILLFLIGIKYKGKVKRSLLTLILFFVSIYIAACGAVLPYVYGLQKQLDTEFNARIFFVEDYITYIGLALWMLLFGQYIGWCIKTNIKTSVVAGISCLVIVIGLLYGNYHGYLGRLIPIDIVRHADLIVEKNVFWNDILDEVKNSEPGSDVVINRVDIPWCDYSYITSLDDIYRDPPVEGYMYGTCNQCASLYYGVRSIVLNLE